MKASSILINSFANDFLKSKVILNYKNNSLKYCMSAESDAATHPIMAKHSSPPPPGIESSS